MNLFFDTQFTGLHKNTTLISIGIISEDGRTFYCELNDYNESQVNDWIRENVIAKLKFRRPAKDEDEPFAATRHESNPVPNNLYNGYSVEFRGTMADLRYQLNTWLFQFKETCYFWSDCLSYGWVLLNHIFGDAFSIPENVYYIPFDICTMFEMIGIDPDISREKFVNRVDGSQKHNALFDAIVIRECYLRISRYSRHAGWVSILGFNSKCRKIKTYESRGALMEVNNDLQTVVKGEMHLNAQTVEYDLKHIKTTDVPLEESKSFTDNAEEKLLDVFNSNQADIVMQGKITGEFGNDEF